MSSDNSVVKIKVSALPNKASDTVLTSMMNGISVPSSTRFELYQHKKRKLNDMILHGENEHLVYDGKVGDDDDSAYCVGVYDPTKQTLKLVRTKLIPARIQSRASFKVKDNYQDNSEVSYLEQRSRLGQEFGTSRAKKALASYRVNRVDGEMMEGNELDIAENVRSSTKNIPDRAQLAEEVEEGRLIPPYNKDATNTEDIYPLDKIISSSEMALLQVDLLQQELESKTAVDKLLEYLPYVGQATEYFTHVLSLVASQGDDSKTSLQMLTYVSALMGLYFNRRERNTEELAEKFQNMPPSLVMEDALHRFADYKPSKNKFFIDPTQEDLLLSYILVIMLKLDDYSLNVGFTAHQLSLRPSRLTVLLNSLGCNLKNATVAELNAFGATREDNVKMAILTAPLRLPPVIRRVRNTQGNRH